MPKESKIIKVTNCDNCNHPVNVPIKVLGQLISEQRQNKPTTAHMRRISLLGVEARRNKKAI